MSKTRKIPEIDLSEQASFWSWVTIKSEDECWEWTRSISKQGYGQFCLSGFQAPFYAHRIAYTLSKGVIPPGLLIMHKCDNRKCCNPKHLISGTHQQNTADMLSKGRHVTPRGEQVVWAKITDVQAREIFLRFHLAEKIYGRIPELKKDYGVSEVVIRRIADRKGWKHATEGLLPQIAGSI